MSFLDKLARVLPISRDFYPSQNEQEKFMTMLQQGLATGDVQPTDANRALYHMNETGQLVLPTSRPTNPEGMVPGENPITYKGKNDDDEMMQIDAPTAQVLGHPDLAGKFTTKGNFRRVIAPQIRASTMAEGMGARTNATIEAENTRKQADINAANSRKDKELATSESNKNADKIAQFRQQMNAILANPNADSDAQDIAKKSIMALDQTGQIPVMSEEKSKFLGLIPMTKTVVTPRGKGKQNPVEPKDTGNVGPDLKQKAIDWLTKHGAQTTPANIDAVIKNKKVQ